MLSNEIRNIAAALSALPLDSADRPDLARRLDAIAAGVESLEAITIPTYARVIPADCRDNVLAFRKAGVI